MQLQEFKFNDNQIRVIEKDGEPWFVAKDVCSYFGDSNYRRSISRIGDDVKGVSRINTPGGSQNMVIINEPGLYELLFSFQPEKARSKDYAPQIESHIEERIKKIKAFKKWVTSEVLPSIRKTGSYSKPKSQAEMLLGMAQILVDMEQKIQSQDLRLEQIENKVEKKFTQEFELQLVTPTQIGAMFEPFLSAKKTNQILRENGFQYTVQGQWVPTSKGKEFSSIDYIQIDNGKMVPQLLWQRRIKDEL